jgi:hypothetical protein
MYISQCMRLSDVKEYTEVINYKRAVYLVTALTGAKGASVRLEADNEIKNKLQAELNNPNSAHLPRQGPRTLLAASLEPLTAVVFVCSRSRSRLRLEITVTARMAWQISVIPFRRWRVALSSASSCSDSRARLNSGWRATNHSLRSAWTPNLHGRKSF